VNKRRPDRENNASLAPVKHSPVITVAVPARVRGGYAVIQGMAGLWPFPLVWLIEIQETGKGGSRTLTGRQPRCGA
jgi:hypothetical protein